MPLLVDQGDRDDFLAVQLKPEVLQQAAKLAAEYVSRLETRDLQPTVGFASRKASQNALNAFGPLLPELLAWAERTQGWIDEEDYDCEYRYSCAPLASLRFDSGQ